MTELMITARPKRTREPKARRHKRDLFTGAIIVDGVRVLVTPDRGAHRRTTDDEGNVLSDTREPRLVLPSNIGDRVIVCGPTIEETAMMLIEAITRDARLYGRLLHGTIAPTTRRVHLLPVKGRADKQLGLFKRRRIR